MLKKGLILVSFKEIEEWLTSLPNTFKNKSSPILETTNINTVLSQLKHTKEILIASSRKSPLIRELLRKSSCVLEE